MKITVDRPTWDEYFLSFAMLASSKSPDAQTQHGCIIVDEDNHIVGVGYNGFSPGIDDSDFDNTRPAKYPLVIHSEANALYNMELKKKNLRAYVTGKPCIECLKAMHANGVREIYYLDRRGSVLEDSTKNEWDLLVSRMDMQVHIISINTQWLVKTATKFN